MTQIPTRRSRAVILLKLHKTLLLSPWRKCTSLFAAWISIQKPKFSTLATRLDIFKSGTCLPCLQNLRRMKPSASASKSKNAIRAALLMLALSEAPLGSALVILSD